MKKITLMAIFTLLVGLLSVNAQDQTTPSQKDEEQVTMDTVVDNSNIPDGTIVDDSERVDDSTGTVHSNHDPGLRNTPNKDIMKEESDHVETENSEGQ